MIKNIYVIGNNTRLSLSPIIFNYWFKKYKISGEYSYIEVNQNKFKKEVKKIFTTHKELGLNITVPYKEQIISMISKSDNHSKSIGAVNCITKINNKILGSNTDWLGIKNSLFWLEKQKKYKQKLKSKEKIAVLIGYGGSAKATIYALEKMKFSKVLLWNRSFNKIKNLKKFKTLKIVPHKLEKNNFFIDPLSNLAINTIPTNKFYINSNVNTVSKRTYGYDLVYNTTTNFLDFFPKTNRIQGIILLLHQAIPCFENWFKVRPKIDKKLINILNQKLKENK